MRRTHFAAHLAYAYLNEVVLSHWLTDVSQALLIPVVRAMMLARMLSLWDTCSTRDDFLAQKAVLISGIRTFVRKGRGGARVSRYR